MQPFILKTDGGSHTPEQWAMATAMTVLPIDPKVVDSRLLAAQKLQVRIAEVLVPHHAHVQTTEQSELAVKGDARLAEPPGHPDVVDTAMAEIVDAAKGSEWEAHLADPEVQAEMRRLLHEHFVSAQLIERSWHQDRKTGA